MTHLIRHKIGSWRLDDLINGTNGKEFQRLLESIGRKVKYTEGKRTELHNNISKERFEEFLRLIEEIAEKVGIASAYAHLSYVSRYHIK